MPIKRQVRLRDVFRPLATGPAENLLRDLSKKHSAHSKTTEVLSLEWGDPRTILFSLHSEGLESLTAFNFTCSSREPAIIGRNIFLLTLIVDGFDSCDSEDSIIALAWRTFFHLAIPKPDLLFIHCKAERLAEYSTTLASWATCPYAKWIRFYDHDTLRRVHSVWCDYASAPFVNEHLGPLSGFFDYDLPGRQAVERMNRMRDGPHVVEGMRSAGLHAARSVSAMSVALDGFWKSGVVGGNKHDADENDRDGMEGGIENPLFALPSAAEGEFTVPWGMEPLAGFHLESAFDDVEGSGQNAIDKLVCAAKAQFGQWSATFAAHVKSRRIRLSLYCGDAILFCYALQAGNPQIPVPPPSTYTYKGAWSSRPTQVLIDKEGRELLFDVIDTSNLTDQVGIINVLPSVLPLLRQEPSSILYTESILKACFNYQLFEVFTSLREMMCSDLGVFALLVGIGPTQFLTGISADSFVAEAARWDVFKQKGYRLRIPWRRMTDSERFLVPDSGRTCSPIFELHELADHIIQVYQTMFKRENRGSGLISRIATEEEANVAVPGDQRYYTRASFALLLRFIKSYIVVEWGKLWPLLLERIREIDSKSICEYRLQELLLQLHDLDLVENVLLKVAPRDLGEPPYDMYQPNDTDTGLLGQPDVPAIVYLALVVPRAKLLFFTNDEFGKSATLPIHLSVQHSLGEKNEFNSFRCFFGRLVKSDQVGTCRVEEDDARWHGSADLIVVCRLPLYTLLHGPRGGVSISLDFDRNPGTERFVRKLGGHSNIFQTLLTDQERLYILREPPTAVVDLEGPVSVAVPRPSCPPSNEREKALARISVFNPSTHLEVKKYISPDSPLGHAISGGAKVTKTSVDTFFSATVTVDGCDPVSFHLPHPIFSGQTNASAFIEGSLRGIELETHTSYPGEGTPLKGNFPLSRDTSGCLFPWTLPRVALRASPSVHRSPQNQKRVQSFVKRCLTSYESLDSLARAKPPQGSVLPGQSPIKLLKFSLGQMIQSIAQYGGDNSDSSPFQASGLTFHLVRALKNAPCHLAIVVAAIRHDFSTSSLFLDAYVIPVQQAPVRAAMEGAGAIAVLNCDVVGPVHDTVWHQFLICCAERCRTWDHQSDCTYGASSPFGKPGTAAAKRLDPPLCRCGEGKMLDGFPPGNPYSLVKQYGTRVAMPLLWGVPYVEPIDINDPPFWDELERINEEKERIKEGKCVNCGANKEGMKKCKRCKGVKYCDAACQRAHWKEHKKVCKEKESDEHEKTEG